MLKRPFHLGYLITLTSLTSLVNAEDVLPQSRLRAAATRGITILQKASSSYPEHRTCFSCHHQTLPALALDAARDHGLSIDEKIFRETIDFAHDSFHDRIASMKRGHGVGGGPLTTGYGLWTMEIGERKRDETTSAMVQYLLKRQEQDGSWKRATERPPLSESHITCTVLAVHYMQKYADDSQKKAVEEAVARARPWLERAKPTTQEDRNSLLGGLALVRSKPERIAEARKRVLAAQNEDGGWGQLPGRASDAYATGQTLFTLKTTRMKATDPTFQRGLSFLLDNQLDDGSWFVKTRSKPLQVFFDNGDPHGKSQFISISATAWATTALSLAVRRDTKTKKAIPYDKRKRESGPPKTKLSL
ncbi:MAG: prenyltransferase/squalene oxidase repeat-containing protein [Planctomycetota bacterium]